MIRSILLDGHINTTLCLNEARPKENNSALLINVLKDQFERIETLEEQNRLLAQQQRLMSQLLEVSSQANITVFRRLKEISSLLQLDKDLEPDNDEPLED